MDADISDILASVSAPAIHPRTLDLQALTRAWINERGSPELLPYPTELMERCAEGLKRQIEVIEDMTGAMDPTANFSLVILQTELERVKFLMRGLLRSRIAKIDAYPQHYTALSSTSLTLLSPLELRYLTSHSALLSTHYHSSFLSQFPSALQKLDDTGGGISMVDAPDEDRAVFVRVLRDGVVERPPEEEVQLRRGDVWVLRWRWVKGGVGRGDLEVI